MNKTAGRLAPAPSPALSNESAALADDALSRLLADLRIAGVGYGHGRFSTPWGIDFPAEGAARLHVIVEGEAWLQVQGEPPVRLAAGDAVFLPRGAAHALRSNLDAATTCAHDLELRQIGERVYTFDRCQRVDAVLSSCSVTFNEPCLHPLLDMMPPMLTVAGAAHDPTLKSLLDAMADEVLAPKIGGATVLARLADVVITRLIRAWVGSQEGQSQGWLALLRDPRMGRALSAMHQDPGRDWCVEELARTSRLSRSLFVDRFAAATGQPPGRYLTRLRMALAGRMLREQRLGVATVAHRLGYGSVPAFSRALKRHLGVSPGQLRRTGPQQP